MFTLLTAVIAQELCESRGGRPGLPVLNKPTVSVDVKQHSTNLTADYTLNLTRTKLGVHAGGESAVRVSGQRGQYVGCVAVALATRVSQATERTKC